MRVNTKVLSDALQLLNRNTHTRKAAMPVLWNVLLSPHDDKLLLQMTDLDTWISLSIPATEVEFTTTIPARMLGELVGLIGKDAQHLDFQHNVRSEKVEVRWNKSVATLLGLDAQSFPALPRAEAEWTQIMTMTGARLAELSRSVVVATQKGKDGSVFECVLFNRNEATATDKAMLAIGCITAESESLLISSNSLRVAADIFKDVDQVQVLVDSEKTELRWRGTDRMVQTPIVDLRFPDASAFRERKFDTELIVDRDELAKALKLCKLYSDACRLWVEKGLSGISAIARQDYGRQQGQVDVELGKINRCPHGGHSHPIANEKLAAIVSALPSGSVAIRWQKGDHILQIDSPGHDGCRYFLAMLKG